MAITFRQLETFVAAASDCNFRRTSDRLCVSQPSISNLVRALEEQLGQNLFERRRGTSPVLTAEGIQYLEKARELLQRRHELERNICGESAPRPLRLVATAGVLLLDAYIRPLLPEFFKSYPHIVLDFVPMHPTRGAVPMVLGGEVDLAVFTGDFIVDQRVESEIIATVGCSIYASPALVRRASRPGAKIGDLPFLMPPVNYRPTRWMHQALQDADIELRDIVGRSQFPDVILNMAIDGRGAAVLFDHFATQAVAEGKLVRFGPPMPSMQRVLLIGPRAKRPGAQPAVDMFRRATRLLDK